MVFRKMAPKPRGTRKGPYGRRGAHGCNQIILAQISELDALIVQQVFAFFVSCCPLTLAIVWARNCFSLAAAVSRPSVMAFTY